MSIKKYAKVHERLEAVINYYGLKGYPALAKFLDVPYQTVMAWKKRGSIGDYASFMDKCPGISLEWLKTGDGEMFPGGGERASTIQTVNDVTKKYEVVKIHRELLPWEAELLDALKIFPDAREAMEAFLQLPPRKQKIYLGKLLEEVEKLQGEGELVPPCVRD